ncbi:MAG: N-formylglutamate amidohydrolase [Desulfofustis sp. PB-SRB1]|jgi:N-formylglutamate deformylase|nr:N-formylglutamate amidohydrolase [Desulfofustis sp. PB-SRB1]MBM1003784.1 N-formylglutamate amidohydrolase [Desulfofustis sp. PB-SRB1]HBH29920.1 N-formylglutamate amidohydrolase [Desulfofustis sp.]
MNKHIVDRVLAEVAPTLKPLPILYSIPHAGRDYPEDFGSALPLEILRRAEDAYVDLLLDKAPDQGITLLTALFPRAYLDVNRDEDDLDPELFTPGIIAAPGPKSRLGIGLIRRVVTPEYRIYDRLLSLDEVKSRIERYYTPYHKKLAECLARLGKLKSPVLFIDWHSMKSVGNAATPDGEGSTRADFVIGDNHGRSCNPALTTAVADYLAARGYHTAINDPYAGGALLQRYAHPSNGVHGLQIEINRALYLDESRITLRSGIEKLKIDVAGLVPLFSAWLSEAVPADKG